MSSPAATIEVDLSDGQGDLGGILRLQQKYLEPHLDPAEVARDGFVTVVHTRAILAAMHAITPSIVARQAGEVVAYALAMPLECRALVPALEPMFAAMQTMAYRGRPVRDLRCYVMGQVCVARQQRGRGLFDALYALHRRTYAARYDLLITDVAVRNLRSRRAHARVGFTELHRYRDESDEWLTIAWSLAG